ncbi:MAG: molybdopterin-dependent oxidoreductase [Phycicoccus sp.]|nr:molybdopterin-dependent oxidoreductase [Phycicoccus sp.]
MSRPASPQGQGHETAFAQIVADEARRADRGRPRHHRRHQRMGYAVGTFASQAAVMSGNAIAFAAKAVREKALRIAADALEANPDDLEIEDGVISTQGRARHVDLAVERRRPVEPSALCLRRGGQEPPQFAGTFDPDKPPVADGEEPSLEGKGVYSPTQATFANGMHAAIVETDPVTAEITILRYCVIHDCGVMVNPLIVEGQVHGGVAQGVGGARSTNGWPDESGQACSMPRSWTSSCPMPPRFRTSRPITSRRRRR